MDTKQSFCTSDATKPLYKYEVGERFCYIDDHMDGCERVRSRISPELADAMAQTVGYKGYGQTENKIFVCVAAGDEYSGVRTFVYKHDFSHYIYLVWKERK